MDMLAQGALSPDNVVKVTTIVVMVVAMVGTSAYLYAAPTFNEPTCALLMWAFAAAALLEIPSAPEPIPPPPPTVMKFKWRGHVL